MRNKLLRFITRGCAEAPTNFDSSKHKNKVQGTTATTKTRSVGLSSVLPILATATATATATGCVMNYWTLLSAAVRRATKFVCHAARRTHWHIGCCCLLLLLLPAACCLPPVACCMLLATPATTTTSTAICQRSRSVSERQRVWAKPMPNMAKPWRMQQPRVRSASPKALPTWLFFHWDLMFPKIKADINLYHKFNSFPSKF